MRSINLVNDVETPQFQFNYWSSHVRRRIVVLVDAGDRESGVVRKVNLIVRFLSFIVLPQNRLRWILDHLTHFNLQHVEDVRAEVGGLLSVLLLLEIKRH